MKYQRLSLEELSTLEKQFIQFLAVNSVTGADWEKIKKNNPTRTNHLIDEFSDVVFGSVIERTNYLVHTQKQEILSFYCQMDEIEIVGLSVEVDFDFTKFEKLSDAIEALPENAKLNTFSLIKKMTLPRDQEIFQLMKTGCQIADELIFLQLKKLLKA
jgi:hypothetical protein